MHNSTATTASTLNEQHEKVKFNRSYIKHQIYGDFPTVTIRDYKTTEAFRLHSPWSFSHSDSPFMSTPLYDQKVEYDARAQKEDVPLGKF